MIKVPLSAIKALVKGQSILGGIVLLTLALGLVIGALSLVGYITALMWNTALVPQGAHAMTVLQGLALNVLAGILTNRVTNKAENKVA